MRVRVLISLALFAATLAVFWRAGDNDFVNLDDHDYVKQNAVVQQGLTRESVAWAFTAFHASNWHPIAWLSHMLDVELYALNPRGHHRSSVLLHAAAAVTLFWALVAMTGAAWRSGFVAALFALHPLHVESVAWVSERKDVLSALFAFAALIAWTRWVQRRSAAGYALALVAFALGLGSKPMLVTFPFALLLLDVWPFARLDASAWPRGAEARARLRALLVEKLPFFALTIASAVVTVLAQHSTGAIQNFERYPLLNRLLNALSSYPAYLLKAVWPSGLSPFYPYPAYWSLEGLLASALLLAVVSVLAWRRRSEQPYLLVGWLWYLGMLLPVIGIVQVGAQQMADRYTYLPLVGPFAAVTWAVSDAARGYRQSAVALAVAAALALSACAALSWQQVGRWRSTEVLFEHALAVDPDNWLAHVFLAQYHRKRGETDRAIEELRKVLASRPEHAQARYDLAAALQQKGELEAAFDNYVLVIQLRRSHPDAYIGAALVARQRGDPATAVTLFGQALRLVPNEEAAYVGLKGALSELRAQHPDQSFLPAEIALLRPEDQMEFYMGRRFDDLGN
jgi:tetratricopeptide (TPR) repeat protein